MTQKWSEKFPKNPILKTQKKEILAILMSASPRKSENHVQESNKVFGNPKSPDLGKTGTSKSQEILISGSLLQNFRCFSEIYSQAQILDHLFWGKISILFAGRSLYLGKPLSEKYLQFLLHFFASIGKSLLRVCTISFHKNIFSLSFWPNLLHNIVSKWMFLCRRFLRRCSISAQASENISYDLSSNCFELGFLFQCGEQTQNPKQQQKTSNTFNDQFKLKVQSLK